MPLVRVLPFRSRVNCLVTLIALESVISLVSTIVSSADAPSIAFYSSGMLDKRASMDIHITSQVVDDHSNSAVDLNISSNRGIMVYMEGESDA